MDENNDLLFDRPLPEQDAANVELVFGEAGREPVQVVDGFLDGQVSPGIGYGLGAPIYTGRLAGVVGARSATFGGPVYSGVLDGRVSPPAALGSAEYDINVHRGPRAEMGAPWQGGSITGHTVGARFAEGAVRSIDRSAVWTAGQRIGCGVGSVFGQPTALASWSRTTWQRSVAYGETVGTAYTVPPALATWGATRWQNPRSLLLETGTVYDAPPAYFLWRDTRWQGARPLACEVSDQFGLAARVIREWWDVLWGHGRPLSGPGEWIPPVRPPEPPAPPQGMIDLLFVCDLLPCNIDLIFGGACCGYRERPEIPIQTTYFMSNSVILLRESDQLELPVIAASVSLDRGAWAWSVNIVTHVSARKHIGRPEHLRLIINGHHFVWIADPPSQDREFGTAKLIQISGRSRHAELDIEPQSDVLTSQITARQLADRALEYTGYNLDWRMTDWLIPAGAYSWDSQTRINRIADIVESVRGRVWGHPSERQLIVQSSYPLPPWAWAAAAARGIPDAVITKMSEQWTEHPQYNSVLVRGERVGYKGRVDRQGTAGDLMAPSVVHPLMTAQEAILERGLVEIASSGWERQVSVTLPLFEDLDLYEPSELVMTTGDESFIGLVRRIGIEAQLQNDALVVRQNLELECKS